jgi:adenylate cyclase
MTKPADLFSDLQIQVAEINRILIDANGEIDKVMGEKILAVFKGNIKDAATNAVKAALNLVEAEQRGLLPFPVAIGINTGVVIAGSLGVGNKRDFTVIGDPVNVSARIASQAEELRFFRVLVSEEISELTHDSYGSRNYGEVELKGKSELLTVFQLEPK